VVDVLIDGERLEGKGVIPDIEVPFTLEYAQGKDPQVERAVEVLLEQV
jgi:carboxyl-terminal processing protease